MIPRPSAITFTALACVLLVAGCVAPKNDAATQTLTVKLHNAGSRDFTTALDVTRPDGTSALHETISVAAGSTVQRTLTASSPGAYKATAHFEVTSDQRVSSGDTDKTVDTTKCAGVHDVLVTFTADASTGMSLAPAETNCAS